MQLQPRLHKGQRFSAERLQHLQMRAGSSDQHSDSSNTEDDDLLAKLDQYEGGVFEPCYPQPAVQPASHSTDLPCSAAESSDDIDLAALEHLLEDIPPRFEVAKPEGYSPALASISGAMGMNRSISCPDCSLGELLDMMKRGLVPKSSVVFQVKPRAGALSPLGQPPSPANSEPSHIRKDGPQRDQGLDSPRHAFDTLKKAANSRVLPHVVPASSKGQGILTRFDPPAAGGGGKPKLAGLGRAASPAALGLAQPALALGSPAPLGAGPSPGRQRAQLRHRTGVDSPSPPRPSPPSVRQQSKFPPSPFQHPSQRLRVRTGPMAALETKPVLSPRDQTRAQSPAVSRPARPAGIRQQVLQNVMQMCEV